MERPTYSHNKQKIETKIKIKTTKLKRTERKGTTIITEKQKIVTGRACVVNPKNKNKKKESRNIQT